ncbi:hypothetical protein [Microbulbifer magnicolonia]|uniref:hypothetical protein n=1 Tax=Microbulbifer magnicolonia TaxID=3109744 RepID=UPI002B406174|nr:hypothetical protein [Microbulbifer sp. GG15]
MTRIIMALLCCLAVQQSMADSRCTITPASWFKQERIDCSYRSIRIPSSSITDREVKWELPLGTPPPGRWR